jgi:hypothetical protein
VGAPFRHDSDVELPVPPVELWQVLGRTDDYPRWWPWLEAFETEGPTDGASPRIPGATALVAGTTARCVIRAPLPYRLRCSIHVDDVEPGRRIDATVTGDLVGPARLELIPVGAGSRARLSWALELRDPVLSRLARVARPAMAWAHDVVVTSGVRQFRDRALVERAPRSTFPTIPPKQKMCPGG